MSLASRLGVAAAAPSAGPATAPPHTAEANDSTTKRRIYAIPARSALLGPLHGAPGSAATRSAADTAGTGNWAFPLAHPRAPSSALVSIAQDPRATSNSARRPEARAIRGILLSSRHTILSLGNMH
jgi:hypothetical protein